MAAVTALVVQAEPTTAVITRLPGPGEPIGTPVVYETRADNVERTGEGVLVLHDDACGYAFYPWPRILRVDYRAAPPSWAPPPP